MAFTKCQYVSDNGTTYQRKCDDALATVLGLTTEAVGAHPPLPRNIKPRYVLYTTADGHERRAVGIDAGSAIFTGSQTTLTWIPERGSATGSTVNRAGAIGEKRYSR
jgi:hypothetical protein